MSRASLCLTAAVVFCSFLAAAAAHAECIEKAGEGTAGSRDGAIFQAYEIILQTTDFFGVWAPWMASSRKIGEAPGYTVKNRQSRCRKGGLGYVCIYQAVLCKK